VVSEEQTILLKELRAKPVLVVIAQCAALAIFGTGWVLRDHIKSQPGDGRQPFGGVLFDEAGRVLALMGLNLSDKRFKLGYQ